MHDLAELERANAALRRSEQRLRAVLDSVSDGLIGTDADWRITVFNRASEVALGVRRQDAIGQRLWNLVPAMRTPDFAGWLRTTCRTGRPGVLEADNIISDGGRAAFRAVPKDGGGVALAFSDITQSSRAEAHRLTLVHELNHRVKNTLATVQAIAAQSFPPDADIGQARAAFEGRLATLAAAHTLLTARNWERALIGDVIADIALAGMERQRFHLAGPAVALPPQTAVLLALGLHELADNARQHGALRSAGGEVAITWEVVPDAEGCLRLQLAWREAGGPPVVTPPRRGFGSRLLEQGLARELGGTVQLVFAPDGLVCRIDMPLPAVCQ